MQKITDKRLEKYFVKSSKKILTLLEDSTYKIDDERTLPNGDSPTGKIYIGVAKHPLQEAKEGHGYLGVLSQTDNRQFIQCHVCGKWFRTITKNHLDGHNTTKQKYCERFGLYSSKALVSDAVSYKLEKAGRTLFLKQNIQENLHHMRKIREKQKRDNNGGKSAKSIERQNMTGTCEKQLEYRLLEYIKKYKMLPSRSTKNEGGKICKTLHRRFGSLNLGFKHYKIPTRHRWGTTVELCSATKDDSIRFNYNQMYNRDEIYAWIVNNSERLR